MIVAISARLEATLGSAYHIERERQLPIADAVLIARDVADALGYAHGHGVIHRDIKPENILLQDGHALVADFGIALAVQQAGGQRMTVPEHVEAAVLRALEKLPAARSVISPPGISPCWTRTARAGGCAPCRAPPAAHGARRE